MTAFINYGLTCRSFLIPSLPCRSIQFGKRRGQYGGNAVTFIGGLSRKIVSTTKAELRVHSLGRSSLLGVALAEALEALWKGVVGVCTLSSLDDWSY
jgi:hypothetical protein